LCARSGIDCRAKGVKRWQRDQLARGDTRAADGITYITATNAGSGEYQRLTLSYQYRWGDHEFWLHTSHSVLSDNYGGRSALTH